MTADWYKVLGPARRAVHGGTGTWPAPRGDKPGRWMPSVADPRCCERGYHLVETWALLQWLTVDCTIWVAEGRGAQHSDGSGKTAFAQARLIRQVHIADRDLRICAADCAEHVLPLFEQERPGDNRPRKAIEAARAFARGEIGDVERADAEAAARDAAGDAAGTAAGTASAAASAAWAAASAARTASAATAASAASAARTASAAWAEAAVAGTGERHWQGEQLARYITDLHTGIPS